jgi:hypothetical protein
MGKVGIKTVVVMEGVIGADGGMEVNKVLTGFDSFSANVKSSEFFDGKNNLTLQGLEVLADSYILGLSNVIRNIEAKNGDAGLMMRRAVSVLEENLVSNGVELGDVDFKEADRLVKDWKKN